MSKISLLLLFCVVAFAQFVVYVDPPRQPPLTPGTDFTVKLRVRNAYGITGWEQAVLFDKNVLYFVSAAEDSFLKYAYGISHSSFFVGPNVDTSGPIGGLYFAATQLGVDSGGVGDGPIAQLTFRSKTNTSSAVIDLIARDTSFPSTHVATNYLDTAVNGVPILCQDGFYGDQSVIPTISKGVRLTSAHETRPAIAYNGTDQEFLVAWEEYSYPTDNSDIRGRRCSSQGDTLGSVISIESGILFRGFSPSVSWNGTNYVVVYGCLYITNLYDYQIRKTVVSPSGGPSGSAWVCNAVRYQGNPAIAWNGTYHLVVWQDARADLMPPRIYGQRLDASGNLVGSNFTISPSESYYHQYPKVVGSNNEFLVVWIDNYGTNSNPNHGRIRGQRVDSNGTLVGSVITIASAGMCPDVAWDGTQYLVVYQNGHPYDIYGQRVSSTGSLIGSAFAINTAANDQTWPRVMFDTQSGKYAVIWVSEQSPPAIWKQIVNTDGTLWGGPGLIADASYHQIFPAIADGVNNDMLVWADLRGGNNFDIYGRAPSSIGIDEDIRPRTVAEMIRVYPTVCNRSLKIELNLENGSVYYLVIYDASGRLIKSFDHLTNQQIIWDRRDDDGKLVTNGVYFVQLKKGNRCITKKIVVAE